MIEYSPLFAELANPARFKMLTLLVEAPHTLGKFAQKIELSKPEISRHLTPGSWTRALCKKKTESIP